VKMTEHKGLTLLELMITVSLLGLLLVLGLSVFDKETRLQHLNDATQQIGYAVKKARYYAKISGDYGVVSFVNNSNTYSIKTDSTSTITNENYMGALSGQLPDNIKIISTNCGVLYFSVDGTLLDSSKQPKTTACTIKVGYNDSPQKSLDIQPGIGNIVDD
jgi:prepilin-type N-terminal cleavage/methylation domain-containing protein